MFHDFRSAISWITILTRLTDDPVVRISVPFTMPIRLQWSNPLVKRWPVVGLTALVILPGMNHLVANAQADYAISTITLYEVSAGAIRSTASGETIETITDAIAWADVVAFDEPAAREAANIRAVLLDRGSPIPAPDILNADVARARNSELIATDEHFTAVPQLDIHNPRDSNA